MLSILIPIYNFNVVELIKDLHQQSINCQINFEILCFDDASDENFKIINRSIKSLENVKYIEIEKNIGRSKIRNQLAEASQFDNLLFLDCDSSLPSRDFIKKYIIHIENYNVVYGGRNYEKNPPQDQEKYFRWYYGIKRESIATAKRKAMPHKSFMTNNFLIRKKAFLSIRLNENIVGYGHEDTLFGIRLKENDVHIEHINNPVTHIGLETFGEFMDKTQQGLKNILFITKFVDITESVRIYNYMLKIKKFKLTTITIWLYRILNKRIHKNLKSLHPNLMYFDLYKLKHILEMERQLTKKDLS